MTVVLATVATIFLMLPGFMFVTGVNLTDKNIREIVFRGTPAELAYVIAVSLIVHLIFALCANDLWSPAGLIADYVAPEKALDGAAVKKIIVASLLYFFLSGLAGLAAGVALALSIRRWRWKFFVKHRWMLMFLGLAPRRSPTRIDQGRTRVSQRLERVANRTPPWLATLVKGVAGVVAPRVSNEVVWARAVTAFESKPGAKETKPSADGAAAESKPAAKPSAGEVPATVSIRAPKPAEPRSSRALIEGLLRDCYFSADGVLLYLVFKEWQAADSPVSDAVSTARSVRSSPSGEEDADDDERHVLVLEGKNVAVVQYERYPLPSLTKIAAEAARRGIDLGRNREGPP